MMKLTPILIALGLGGLAACAAVEAPKPATGSQIAFDGNQLVLPVNRDRWITLGVTYALSHEGGGEVAFNTVRADPASYDAFVKTGQFPKGAMLDLEVRRPVDNVAPSRGGRTQGAVLARAIHVKDETAGPGTWTFYAYPIDGWQGTPIPRTQACYTCHKDNAATDTVFTQFYPTMMEARAKAAKTP